LSEVPNDLPVTSADANTVPTDAATPGCPTLDPTMGALVTCHMKLFLQMAGFSNAQYLSDATFLSQAGAGAQLLARGFMKKKPATSAVSELYELGTPRLYSDGQSAIFWASDASAQTGGAIPNAALELDTFVKANGGFVQSIIILPSGKVVSNDVQ